MRYFRAIELDHKPFIQWDCWATNEEDYLTLELDKDPLVLPEDDIPEYQFGVCPLKIVDGQLVQRTQSEMNAYQSEYNQVAESDRYAGTIREIDKAFFEFNRERYPLHQSARLLYEIAEKEQTSVELKTVDNKRILIDSKDLPAFVNSFRTQLKTIINTKL